MSRFEAYNFMKKTDTQTSFESNSFSKESLIDKRVLESHPCMLLSGLLRLRPGCVYSAFYYSSFRCYRNSFHRYSFFDLAYFQSFFKNIPLSSFDWQNNDHTFLT